MNKEVLKYRQSLPLEEKIKLTNERIKEWYDAWGGEVYISFSGGKDSTVLLNLVRKIYPNVPAVFVNTGLEYPEILSFVHSIDNVTILRPKMKFKDVLDKYGYPVLSRKISMGISRYRNTKSDIQKQLRLHGGINPTSKKKQHKTIPIKYHHMIDAPFKISEQCCVIMKERSLKQFSGFGFVGIMADNSFDRQRRYLKQGCNAFNNKKPMSWPLAFWTEKDIWEYIEMFDIPYSKIYDMGYDRTGCMFCMFGVHMEKGLNRFQKMKNTHPKHYKYCMEILGLKEILKYINVPYE